MRKNSRIHLLTGFSLLSNECQTFVVQLIKHLCSKAMSLVFDVAKIIQSTLNLP